MDTTNSNQKQKQKTIDEDLHMAKFMVSTNRQQQKKTQEIILIRFVIITNQIKIKLNKSACVLK